MIPPGCRRGLARPDDVARFAAWSLAPSDAPLLDTVCVEHEQDRHNCASRDRMCDDMGGA
jgi:hypothetical protein